MINHILVVDDDVRVVETFARNLALMGYHVSTAADGETALTRYVQTPPDLALVDIRMPGIDGLEVLRAVRARDPEAEIIIITGHGDMEIAIQALRLGASDFLPKPVDRMTLEATLQRAEARLSLKRRLQAEQTRFLWVVEHADVGYLILDAGDHILYANPQARTYLGLPETGALSATQTFHELAAARYDFHPEQDWCDWPCSPESALEACLYLVQPNVAGEDACWLRVDRAAMTREEEPRYLIRIKDVSADIAGRSFVWTFERMIGHKLKDPLGQLTGFLQLLEADWPTLSPEAIAADLAEARHGAETLKARLMDIFAYLEAPGLGRGACPLAALPEMVAHIKKGLSLETIMLDMAAVQPDVTLPLAPQAVELILWELCENARKFHPVHTPTIKIAVVAAPEGLRLTVSDDGVHLTPAALRKLGTPYYQAESTFTADMPGMGLGVATVAALVWDVGGVFQVRNREDKPGLNVELLFSHVVA